MTIGELVSHLRSLNVRIWSEDGQLRCNAPKGSLTPALRGMLAERKAEILDFLKDAPPPVQRVPRDGPLPVSFAQQRLWFIDRLEPNSALYNISINVRLEGPLDVAALEKTLNALVRRHESLRTTLPDIDGQPVQSIAPFLIIPLPAIDLRAFPETQRDAEIRRLSDEEARQPFDFARGPLLRATLLQAAAEDHLLLLTMHHIVSDGWSMAILFRECAALYSAFSAGSGTAEGTLDELPVQYADFAQWQHQRLRGRVLENLLGYWENQLRHSPVLDLHSDRPRPAVQSYRGAEHCFMIHRELTEDLAEIGKRENATLFMTLLTAFFVLLYRHTGQDDIVVGSPIAGRNRAEIEGLIGFFVNTMALRGDLSGDPTFRQALARVRETALGAYAHQDLPFEKLVEKLQPDRNLSRHPLFQVMFVLQNAPAAPPQFAGLTATLLRQPETTAKIDLMLTLREKQGQLEGSLQYSTDLFDAATMERMAAQYLTLLAGIAANPDRCIAELPILTLDERQLLSEWNDTRVEYPRDKSIHELFEAQAERTPEAIAVVFGNRELRYAELNARANQLAHYLKKRGVESEAPVAICVERSLEMIVGILGILKAGGAYVPLDPAYPRERLAFILENTQANLLLTMGRLSPRLPASNAVRLDTDWPAIALESDCNPDRSSGAANLAYIMYTSGSTGAPKGVRIEHRGVVRLVKGANYVDLGPEEVLLQFAPLAFDASTFEIWASLLHGSKLVVFPPHSPTLEELGEFIENQRITTLWLTAALFVEMVDSQLERLRHVRQLLAGGDVLPVSHVNRVLASKDRGRMRLINGYGPTENTTFTCCHVMDSPVETEHSVPIGKPISNTRVYILDGRGPAPIGAPGELYAGGDGVARDYHGAPELTAEKFFPDPFSNEPGARMYRTGDRARYLTDGTIEFLGRLDDQVKIRGFRIEPGEIESVLGRHPGVGRVVVLTAAEGGASSGKSLAAYIVARHNPAPTADELRAHVKETLPGYMTPSAFIFLDAIPVTANGKVDRRALAAPDRAVRVSEKHGAAPRDHVERQLVDIWKSVLQTGAIGVTDSFFDLGGHSLLAVRVASKIEKLFRKRLPLAAFFQAPTVEHLARLLREEISLSPWESLLTIQTKGSRSPFFWVHGERSNAVLPRYLHPDQPLYGLLHQSEDGTPARYKSVEDIASHYLREIRTVQPHGPYFLGGYCFGGMVAFEMAQQLTLLHENVALVALLAPSTPYSGRSNGFHRPPAGSRTWRGEVSRHLKNLEQLEPAEKRTYVLARAKNRIARAFSPVVNPVRKSLQKAACAVILRLGYPIPLFLRNFYILDVYRQAMRRYCAKPYGGSVVLFLPDSHLDHSRRAWCELSTEKAGVIEFPGEHTDILQESEVKTWAEPLSSLLDAAQTQINL